LYPNPTTGELTLQGVESGNTIHIFNAAGKRVVIMNAHSEFEKASLHNQPSGLFMVVIHDGTKVIERFKVIKR